MSNEAKGPYQQGPPPPLDQLGSLMAIGMIGYSTEPPAVISTHVSVVLFVGDRVYKVKKPVDLGFLDFRSRQAREAACHREVELNRRLSPDVYLGVADLTDPSGRPFDHLVVMRRMPIDRRLSTLVSNGVDVDAELAAIAEVLANFHAHAETSKEISEAGTIDRHRLNWKSNTDELRTLALSSTTPPIPLDLTTVEEMAILAERYISGRSALFNRRITEGRIRDGHGDVLADDIFCLPDGPRILDCIEFDDRLRHGDVLGDVAFLAMDLERLGAPALGAKLLEHYRQLTHETFPESLVDFWIAYRAQVRAKVAALRAGQGDPAATTEAGRLLDIALAHLKRSQVRLVLIGGAPGTGKSTLASSIARHQGWDLVRSDEIRKALVGLAATDHSGREVVVGKGIYDQEITNSTYEGMLTRAEDQLEQGVSVVLDASWSDPVLRARAATVTANTHSDLIELCCNAPLEVVLERVEERASRGDDASDANVEIARALSTRPPWPSATVIDTSRTLEDSMAQVLEALGELQEEKERSDRYGPLQDGS